MTVSRVAIIKVPFDLGAGTRGASLAPDCMLQEAGLIEKLSSLSIPYEMAGEVIISPDIADAAKASIGPSHSSLHMKHIAEVYAMSDSLAEHVSSAAATSAFPLVLGGDHSIAIGTIAGLAEHYANMGVIWFDAHSDMNTEHTSPSGNIHGMSLGVSLGRGFEPLTKLRGIYPKIKPEHVAIIGARSLDPDEKQFIRSLGVACYTMHDIDRMGIAKVMDEVIRRMQHGTDGVHISFDIDSVDPREAPGTGTPVKGGLSYREAHLAMELLYQSGIVTSAELVEVNPSLDHGLKTATLAVELIGSLLGEQIL